jgi:hypothetical protein
MEQNERLDKIEHHLELMKRSNSEMYENVSLIKTSLVGSEYSAGIGLVHSIKDIKERMEKTEDEISSLKENMNILKWIARSIGTIIIASIAYLIQKK